MTIVCIPFSNNNGKSFTGIIFLEKKNTPFYLQNECFQIVIRIFL